MTSSIVEGGAALFPPLISLIVDGVKQWKEAKEAERRQLLRLRREVRGNLHALAFSRYDQENLAIATEGFYTLAGSLDASATLESYEANFKARKPPASTVKKQDLIRFTRYSLRYTVDQVGDLKKLTAYKEGQTLPNIRLTRRLDVLKKHLEQLDAILAEIPTELPPRKKLPQAGAKGTTGGPETRKKGRKVK
jgi:hypothetical protein